MSYLSNLKRELIRNLDIIEKLYDYHPGELLPKFRFKEVPSNTFTSHLDFSLDLQCSQDLFKELCEIVYQLAIANGYGIISWKDPINGCHFYVESYTGFKMIMSSSIQSAESLLS